MRVRSLVPGLLIIALLFAPNAAAQPKALITVKIKWSMEHDMELGENGRGDMGTIVEAFGEDFVCAQPYKFKVELEIKDLPKVYGSSMSPKVVPSAKDKYFVFDQGKVGLKPASAGEKAVNSPNEDGNLDIAWDLDGIPKTDANYDYVLKGTVKPEGSGSCYPAPELRVLESAPMKVKIADRLPESEAPVNPQRCLDDPSTLGCPTASLLDEPGGTAAGLHVVAGVLGVVGLLGILRRRR
jgi:hypothetical protein